MEGFSLLNPQNETFLQTFTYQLPPNVRKDHQNVKELVSLHLSSALRAHYSNVFEIQFPIIACRSYFDTVSIRLCELNHG